ncbi:hypothetical protein BDV18DRAFT_134166 [Aspergillus unguis]
MNKLDPRVDSDNSRLHSGNNYGTGHGTGAYGTESNVAHGHHGRDSTSTKTFEDAHFNSNPSATHSTSTNAGPHSSNLMNKADPRVDSDMDARSKYAPGTTSTGNTYTSTTGNAGPHSSNLANKADPRVDSDMDARSKYAPGTTSTGNTYTATSGNAGPHTSNMGNKVDPRVDSDMDNRSKYAPGTTTAPGTSNAGPHGSNMMNKADPRVDSDMDNRAKYAPNTTTTGNSAGPTHAYGHSGARKGSTGGFTDATATGAGAGTGTGTGTSAAAGSGSAAGAGSTATHGAEKVHSSNLLNKLDPRVDSTTGTMKNASHGQHSTPNYSHDADRTGAGTTDTTGKGYNTGSSGTGYDTGHTGSGYNTGTTGSGYNTGSTGYGNTASNSAGHTGQTTSTRTGENVGSGAKGAAAEIHGMGESLRGGMGAAVDRAFGHEEGVAKNRNIAKMGDREMRTGDFNY